MSGDSPSRCFTSGTTSSQSCACVAKAKSASGGRSVTTFLARMESYRRSKKNSELAPRGLSTSVFSHSRGQAHSAPSHVARAQNVDNDLCRSDKATRSRSDDFGTGPEKCNRTCASGNPGFLQQGISCPQKVGKAPSRYRFVKTKSLSRKGHLQDGHSHSHPRVNRTRNVGSLLGSVRRLLAHPDASRRPQFSSLSDRRRNLPISSTTFRPLDSSVRIFRGHEVSEAVGQIHGSTSLPVLGRLATYESGSKHSGSSDETSAPLLLETGLTSQLREVRAGPVSKSGIPGRSVRFLTRSDPSYGREICKNLSQNPGHDVISYDDSLEIAFTNGTAVRHGTNCSFGAHSLPCLSESSIASLSSQSAHGSTSSVNKCRTYVSSLVDQTLQRLARCYDGRHPSDVGNPNRCFHSWLGLFLSGTGTKRRLVSNGFRTAYKFSGDDGRFQSLFALVLTFCRSCSELPDRQRYCCSLLEESGWHQVGKPVHNDSPNSSICSEEPFFDPSQTYCGSTKRNSGFSLAPGSDYQHGVELGSGHVSVDPEQLTVGSGDSGSVCKSTESSTASLCLSVSGLTGQPHQFHGDFLAQGDLLRIPSDNAPCTSLTEDSTGAATSSSAGGSTFARSSVVSGSGSLTQISSASTSASDFGTVTAALGASSSQSISVQSASLVHSFPFLRTQGFSGGVIDRMDQVHMPSTNKAYASQWKLFAGWCERRDLDPHKTTSVAVSDFFMYLFNDRKVQARTIEAYRAAISFVLLRSSGYDLSKCTVLQDLIRSFRVERPTLIKSTVQWNLSVVLDYLSLDRFQIPTVSDKDLTIKTLFLVALAAGKRRGELHALERQSVVFDSNMAGVTLKPHANFVGKTHIRSKGLGTFSEILIPSLDTDPDNGELSRLCPVQTLQSYVLLTDKFRSTDQTRLFISFNRAKSSDITAQTVSRYIKLAITEAYQTIESSTDEQLLKYNIKAHQVRHVAHSMGQLKNVTLDDIVKNGGWTSSNTFITRYLQDVSSLELDKLVNVGSFVAIEQVFSPGKRSPYCFRDKGKAWKKNTAYQKKPARGTTK